MPLKLGAAILRAHATPGTGISQAFETVLFCECPGLNRFEMQEKLSS